MGDFDKKGFSLALNGTILSSFEPKDEMPTPHDITIAKDGKCLYVAQLRPHRVFKVILAYPIFFVNHRFFFSFIFSRFQ